MPTQILHSAPTAPQHSFRERLQAELAARCERNPGYSLRAYANYLGIDHATLSQLMRGKRSMTEATVRRLGERIGLASEEVEVYASRGEPVRPGSAQVRALAEDAAQVFGRWHAFAILELMRLRSFRPDVRWIARVLGVSATEVQVALQHLLRLGFLQMESPTCWRDLTGGAILREEDFTMLALERLAARSREVQLASAHNAPEASRAHGAVTIALAEKDVGRLMKLVEQFLADVQACGAGAAGRAILCPDVRGGGRLRGLRRVGLSPWRHCADPAAGTARRRCHGHPQGSERHVVWHHGAPFRLRSISPRAASTQARSRAGSPPGRSARPRCRSPACPD
jgi:transcriptional regulator with XRE-family HTH domain